MNEKHKKILTNDNDEKIRKPDKKRGYNLKLTKTQ